VALSDIVMRKTTAHPLQIHHKRRHICNMKPRATPNIPTAYRDLKALRRNTGLWDPFDFRDYLKARLRRLKPATVLAIAKYHRMRRAVSDPEQVALWLAETIFEKSAWR